VAWQLYGRQFHKKKVLGEMKHRNLNHYAAHLSKNMLTFVSCLARTAEHSQSVAGMGVNRGGTAESGPPPENVLRGPPVGGPPPPEIDDI